MATVLTQSYLLLGEEPLEKIATKLPINGTSVVTNGGIAVDYSTMGNGTIPRVISNGKVQPGLNGTPPTTDAKFEESETRTSLPNKIIIPSKGPIKSESNQITPINVETSPIGNLPNINGIKSVSTSLLSSVCDEEHFKNGFVQKCQGVTSETSEKIQDSADKLLSSDATCADIHSNGIRPNIIEKRVNGVATVYSEKNGENTTSDQALPKQPIPDDKHQIPVIYKWTNIVAILSIHLMAVYGIGYMAWHWSTLTILFSFLTGGLSGFGVTGGAHRLWTHRAYKAKTPLQIVLLFCYTLAGQNTVYEWVRDHRVHHKYSETDADPHNSNRGFFFSHVGWLLTRKHPEVIDKGNKIDMSDITSDPLLEWHRRYFSWLRLLICYILPVWIPMHFWNETFTYAFYSNAVRYAMSLNATWSVNSFAHIWGYKPYDRRIMPVENLGVAIFAMGEGWHNYHHAFPWDYRASEMGYRYNFTAFLIDQFAKIGWAYDLKRPSESLVATMAAKYGEVPRRIDHHIQPIEPQETKKSS